MYNVSWSVPEHPELAILVFTLHAAIRKQAM